MQYELHLLFGVVGVAITEVIIFTLNVSCDDDCCKRHKVL